jgi:hypothetical protein
MLRKPIKGGLILGEVALENRELGDRFGKCASQSDLLLPILSTTDEDQTLILECHILISSIIAPLLWQYNGDVDLRKELESART